MIKAKNLKDIAEILDNKKVFLFDFDGTIAHTERLQWEAFNIVLKKYNVIIPKEKWISYIGTPEIEIYKLIKKDFNVEFDDDETLKERMNVSLGLVREKELKPFSIFFELLNNYADVKFYILTSNREEIVNDILEYWNLINRFKQVISIANKEITKKDVLSNTVKYLEVEKSEVVYFEDVDKNLKIANELEIAAIGVEHEFNYNQLKSCDAVIAGQELI